VLEASRRLQRRPSGGKKVSLADLIVLAAGRVEAAAKAAGHASRCPSRRAHRRHAGADRCESFAVLEPEADGFRNYQKQDYRCRPRRCCSTRPSC
jgi:catalase-peroxidase